MSSPKKYDLRRAESQSHFKFVLPANFFFLLEVKHDKIVKYSYNLQRDFLARIDQELNS